MEKANKISLNLSVNGHISSNNSSTVKTLIHINAEKKLNALTRQSTPLSSVEAKVYIQENTRFIAMDNQI